MKYCFILLAVFAIYSCKKENDISDIPDIPNTPDTPGSIQIHPDKARVVFDMFHMKDTITVDAPGSWDVSTTPSFDDMHSLLVSRIKSDSSKLVLSVNDDIYDGKDLHTSLRIKMVNSPDTAFVDIPVSYLATSRDTFAFGGEGDDEFNAVISYMGDITVVGYSESSHIGNAHNHGGKDVWVKRINRFGNSNWDRLLGGSGDDVATRILLGWSGSGGTSYLDGYLIAGYTYSNDGDVVGNHGAKDAWLIKIDTAGNLVWQKTFGTTHDDEIDEITQGDGNLLISGIKDGDQWMCKMDDRGNVIWERTFGSSAIDQAGSYTAVFEEGATMFAGSGTAADGDVADKPTSTLDAWLVSLSKETGDVKWKQYVGGAGEDRGIGGFYQMNNEVFLIGTTESSDIFPDFSGHRNIFIAAFDRSDGTFLYKKIIKNTDWDDLTRVSATSTLDLMLLGKSRRPNF